MPTYAFYLIVITLCRPAEPTRPHYNNYVVLHLLCIKLNWRCAQAENYCYLHINSNTLFYNNYCTNICYISRINNLPLIIIILLHPDSAPYLAPSLIRVNIWRSQRTLSNISMNSKMCLYSSAGKRFWCLVSR